MLCDAMAVSRALSTSVRSSCIMTTLFSRSKAVSAVCASSRDFFAFLACKAYQSALLMRFGAPEGQAVVQIGLHQRIRHRLGGFRIRAGVDDVQDIAVVHHRDAGAVDDDLGQPAPEIARVALGAVLILLDEGGIGKPAKLVDGLPHHGIVGDQTHLGADIGTARRAAHHLARHRIGFQKIEIDMGFGIPAGRRQLDRPTPPPSRQKIVVAAIRIHRAHKIRQN